MLGGRVLREFSSIHPLSSFFFVSLLAYVRNPNVLTRMRSAWFVGTRAQPSVVGQSTTETARIGALPSLTGLPRHLEWEQKWEGRRSP
jgi:hypothetical protein